MSISDFPVSGAPVSSELQIARVMLQSGALTGTAATSGVPRRLAKSSASLSGAGTMVAPGRRIRMAAALLSGFGSVLVSGLKLTARPSASLLGQATVSPHERTDLQAHASLLGSAFLVGDLNFILYTSTNEFITAPTDTPPNMPFYGTLQKALRLDRSIINGLGFGMITSGWGELELINLEGDYDFLIKHYSIDGRKVNIKIGAAGAAYDSFITLFTGTATGWHVAEDILRVGIRDNGYLLEVPMQTNLYLGTGGLEGPVDLKGKRRPLGYGENQNVSPPLVVPSYLVYQLNDGQIHAVDAVYDRAVALTPAGPADYATSTTLLAATTGAGGSGANIEAGEFATCLAEGYVRLGGTPFGQVTVDFRGDKTGGVYVNTTAGIVKRIVSRANSSIVLRTSTFDALDAVQPAEVHFYSDPASELQVTDVVSMLMAGIGAWAGFRRDGKFEVGIFTPPGGASTAQYNQDDIIEIERQPLPAGVDPPPWRFRVAWGRNWTVQTDVDGQSGMTPERVAFLAEQFRLASSDAAQGTLIKTNHARAQDPAPIESYFVNEADAQTEADRLLDIYGITNSLYRIVLTRHPFVHEIGDVILVTYRRWDLTRGRLLRIVALTEETDESRTELIGFG